MGLINRLFGGDDSAPQPPALPKFDYELMYVRGKDAVRRALELRQEWAGVATPLIIGTQDNFSDLTDLWGEEDFAAVTPQDYLDSATKLDLGKWFQDQRTEVAEDPEHLEHINKPSDWNTRTGAGEDFSVVREVLSRKLHPWVLLAKIPTPQPYETPAYLKFGGWNACPEASVHVAVWKNGRKNTAQRFYASAETSLKQRSPGLRSRKPHVINWPRTNLRIAPISWTRAWEASTPSPPHCTPANRGTFGGTNLRTDRNEQSAEGGASTG